ncbi:MAG: GGDEF domain-containing protein, partial [Burkholderiaceae bacterium]
MSSADRLDRLDRLERVIHTQSLLVQADLDLDGYMQLVVDGVRDLTQAQGAVVELVNGDDSVCRSISGRAAPRVGTRLALAASLSGLCVRDAEVVCCEDSAA